jgi:hypothetical protein
MLTVRMAAEQPDANTRRSIVSIGLSVNSMTDQAFRILPPNFVSIIVLISI